MNALSLMPLVFYLYNTKPIRYISGSWGVKYASKNICAFEGSTVEMSCTYTYPPRINDQETVVQRTFWFTELRSKEQLDLREDINYAGRITYHCSDKNCSLKIWDLKLNDQAEYKFSFETNQPDRNAPKSVSVSIDLTEIIEGSSVTLTCSCDAKPAAKFRWYKNNQTLLHEGPTLILGSVHRSDSGRYHCVAENKLWETASEHAFINVEYPPETSTVSVSPSAEILEGSSVTLTCSSDANPAANYTWFKDNRTLISEQKVNFSSVRSEDSGNYSCKSENKHGQSSSVPLLLDVQYSPRIPSVSVNVSAEILEGSSVTLTCSSDANPAANYTWFKKDEDSPKASGPNWTISDFRAELSGFYYCEAENRRGRIQSPVTLNKSSRSWESQQV
uniref:Ig-like domain-containing protein n=1 Tax=Oryzias melastigma TaxID=30732 RepID=A0A3B3BRE2_ORYME